MRTMSQGEGRESRPAGSIARASRLEAVKAEKVEIRERLHGVLRRLDGRHAGGVGGRGEVVRHTDTLRAGRKRPPELLDLEHTLSGTHLALRQHHAALGVEPRQALHACVDAEDAAAMRGGRVRKRASRPELAREVDAQRVRRVLEVELALLELRRIDADRISSQPRPPDDKPQRAGGEWWMGDPSEWVGGEARACESMPMTKRSPGLPSRLPMEVMWISGWSAWDSGGVVSSARARLRLFVLPSAGRVK
jgi:hypothetical protein